MKEKIIQLVSGIYYIPNSTNAGIIASHSSNGENELYIIDSGPSEIEGEYILDTLDEYFKDYIVKALITTHGHPDHTGGHKFIKDSTNCEVWISEKEKPFMENPALHGSILWGSYPPKELRSLYFRPEACKADKIIGKEDIVTLEDGFKFSFIALDGHSPESLGVIVENPQNEKVLFAGDSIFPRKELGQHWISLLTNPILFMEALDKIGETEEIRYCVPSHGELLCDDIAENVEMNKIAILSTKQCIINALKKGRKTTEELVKYVADFHSLNMKIPQYALITSTVKSYLSEMQDERKVLLTVEDNILYYSLRK